MIAADRDLHAKVADQAKAKASALQEAQQASGDALAVMMQNVEELTVQLQKCTCGAAGASSTAVTGAAAPARQAAPSKKKGWFKK